MSEVRQVPLEEVLELPVYPTADIFPMLMNKAEAPGSVQAMTLTINDFADQLLDDGGVKEPLVVWNGMLVDGRNRRAAAKIAELETVPVREENFSDEMEADRFIVSLNITRRQMTKSQTAAVAALYWSLYEGRQGRPSSENPSKNGRVEGTTQDVLSKMFHVNHTYVNEAHKLHITDPEKFKQLHEGRKSLSDVKKSPGQEVKNEIAPTKRASESITRAAESLRKNLEVFGDYETDQTEWSVYVREILHVLRIGAKSFDIEITDEEYEAARRAFHVNIQEAEDDES